MKYAVDCSLENFSAWSGGRDTLEVLIEKDLCERVEQILDEFFAGQEETPTETEINDILWFERDWIAEMLGYKDWEDLENSDEAHKYKDINGVELDVNDKVYWYDEAGYNEDGSLIVFTIVEDDGNGYFNLATEGEKYPERWAYFSELEIV